MCLLVGGGLKSVAQVAESCRSQTPVLVCHGTGKAADLIAETLELYSRDENSVVSRDESTLRDKTKALIKQHLSNVGGERRDTLLENLATITERRKYVRLIDGLDRFW